MNQNWTQSEVLFLQENFQDMTFASIAKHLNRTVSSIESKAKALALKKEHKVIYSKDFLVEEYINKEKSIATIAKETNHSTYCVTTYMRKYKIKIRTLSPQGDFSGARRGNIIIVRQQTPEEAKTYTKWVCICDCGEEFLASHTSICRGLKSCVKCLPQQEKNLIVRRPYLNRIHDGAKKRQLDFNITLEYISDLAKDQNFSCALTGMPLVFSKGYKEDCLQTASLDRIDSTKGYVEGNVQWVLKSVNFMKQNLSEKEFISLCEKVVNFKVDVNPKR